MSKSSLQCSLVKALVLVAVASTPAAAQVCAPLDDGRVAEAFYEGTVIFWDPVVDYREMVLTISGPCEDITKVFRKGEPISFDIREIERVTDGTYTWQLRRVSNIDPGVQKKLEGARGTGEEDALWWSFFQKGAIPEGPYVDSASFTVERGTIIDPNQVEGKSAAVASRARSAGSALAAGLAPGSSDGGTGGGNVVATKDFVINDDLIVIGSACVGFDCVNGESFGFDTIRLKENNLRIQFNDTSAGSFPTRNWQIRANSSASGGQNFLGFVDQGNNDTGETGTLVFAVEAAARANALYVESDGDVGIGTSNPILDLHITTSNTPGIRLEQTSAGGFTAQTWDIAGNETNFFVRDVTGGSRLPFRIRPNAPTNSIHIANDGDVGFGTASPDSALHVLRNSSSFVPGLNLQNQGGDVGFRLTNDFGVIDLNVVEAGGLNEFRINIGASPAELTLQADGDLIITGTYTPDYVFEPDYPLMPLAELREFIAREGHLPNVPSDAEVKRTGRINLSQFQLRLLEKIEELTLYTLEQDEFIGSLRNELEAKDGKIAEVQRRNSELAAGQDSVLREIESLQEAIAALQSEK